MQPDPALTPILKIERLSKFYGETRGVENLSLDVYAGEIFGFLGPNGAGKTTTIRVIMGLLHPSAGGIYLFDQPLRPKDVHLRENLGYLPGDFSPYKEMTARCYLDYIASYRSRPAKWRTRLMEQLQFSAEFQKRKIKHLSHGNRQKLGIVSGLEHAPALAILDEPTLGLDPLIQARFYQIMREMREQGTTFFLSSHNLPEVEKNCQRAAIIREGKLAALQHIGELKKQIRRRALLALPPGFKPEQVQRPGFRLAGRESPYWVYEFTGEIQPLLHYLAGLPLLDLILPEPDLEDIFRSFYREGG